VPQTVMHPAPLLLIACAAMADLAPPA
jgi:hypothetical protein